MRVSIFVSVWNGLFIHSRSSLITLFSSEGKNCTFYLLAKTNRLTEVVSSFFRLAQKKKKIAPHFFRSEFDEILNSRLDFKSTDPIPVSAGLGSD